MLLVGLQFVCLGVLLSQLSLDGISLTGGVLLGTALFLATWALAAMRKSRLRIQPIPASDAVLITSGPYRYIRHPMYTAVLTGSAGIASTSNSFLVIPVLLVLAVVLIIKLSWEEKMLVHKFAAYTNYKHRTWRLIPFLF